MELHFGSFCIEVYFQNSALNFNNIFYSQNNNTHHNVYLKAIISI